MINTPIPLFFFFSRGSNTRWFFLGCPAQSLTDHLWSWHRGSQFQRGIERRIPGRTDELQLSLFCYHTGGCSDDQRFKGRNFGRVRDSFFDTKHWSCGLNEQLYNRFYSGRPLYSCVKEREGENLLLYSLKLFCQHAPYLFKKIWYFSSAFIITFSLNSLLILAWKVYKCSTYIFWGVYAGLWRMLHSWYGCILNIWSAKIYYS